MSNFIHIPVFDYSGEINMIFDQNCNIIRQITVPFKDLLTLIGKTHYLRTNENSGIKIVDILTDNVSVELNGLKIRSIYISANYVLIAEKSSNIFDSYYFDEPAKKLIKKSQLTIPEKITMYGARNDCIVLESENTISLFSLSSNAIIDSAEYSVANLEFYQDGTKFVKGEGRRICEDWSTNLIIMGDYIYNVDTKKIVTKNEIGIFDRQYLNYIRTELQIRDLKLIHTDKWHTNYYLAL